MTRVCAPPTWCRSTSPPEQLNPLLQSGLAFAGANEPTAQADGVLTALEASSMDLSGTKLVVLSACDSGVGEIRTGQGVIGLRRAFELAGAETQVMSLWKVDDEATRRLMVGFYESLPGAEAAAKRCARSSSRCSTTKARRTPSIGRRSSCRGTMARWTKENAVSLRRP